MSAASIRETYRTGDRMTAYQTLEQRFARLAAWRDRCTARPGYRKALAAQVAQYVVEPVVA